MKRALGVLLLTLFITGCAAEYGSRLDKLGAILATETDVIINRIEDRRCKLPTDVLERIVNKRGMDWFEGWALQCPAPKRLFDSLKQPLQLMPPTVFIE